MNHDDLPLPIDFYAAARGLAFIAAFAPELAKIDPLMVADPRPVGGSLFRIHRDTRFAKDKSPYKTHAAMHFRGAADRNTPRRASTCTSGPGTSWRARASGTPIPTP